MIRVVIRDGGGVGGRWWFRGRTGRGGVWGDRVGVSFRVRGWVG